MIDIALLAWLDKEQRSPGMLYGDTRMIRAPTMSTSKSQDQQKHVKTKHFVKCYNT